jgi:hypothetical protein
VNKTKSQEVAADVSALLRARNALIWIVTSEEARVERHLFDVARASNYRPVTWDVAQGVLTAEGGPAGFGGPDLGETLAAISERARGRNADPGKGMWIMRDLPPFLEGYAGARELRMVRNLARMLPTTPPTTAQAVIVLTPSAKVPPELAGHATVIEWPIPDRAEIAETLDAAVSSLPEFENGADGRPNPAKPLRAVACPADVREAAIDAAVGLSGSEAASCYARSIISTKRIEPRMVAAEKRRVIAREQVLTWYDPLPGGLESVGGLDNLKAWLTARSAAYSAEARAYGLPAPKGAFLAGVPGCGKSMISQAIATAWGFPLLRFDLGALRSKFVGDSEANIRKAFRVVEAIGRCVIWFDEMEKALAGANGGAADGGVASDALGTMLSWMQERKGESFVVATANDVTILPPELLRAGRFDAVWWVDLPTRTERVAVLRATLVTYGRNPEAVGNLAKVAEVTAGFSGAELASIIPEAMFLAFAEKRDVVVADLIRAAREVVPLSKTAGEKLGAMRKWAEGKTRAASRPEAVEAGIVTTFDLD